MNREELNEVPMWEPLPLQCGERIAVRGQIWEVRQIANGIAKMVLIESEPNPTVKRVKDDLIGTTLTAGEAIDLIDAIRMCTKPE